MKHNPPKFTKNGEEWTENLTGISLLEMLI